MYLFFDNLQSAATEEIDAFTLFEYCRDSNIPAAYVAVKEGALYREMAGRPGEGIFFVKNGRENWLLNKELFAVLLRARAVVTSFGCIHSGLEKYFRKGENIEYIFIGHGTTFFKISHLKNYYMSMKRYNRILISNEYEKELLLKYGWKEKHFIKAGLPRWDRLMARGNKNDSAKNILIFFTWRQSFQTPGADPETFEYVKKLRDFISCDRLKSVKEKFAVEFYVAPHHSLLDECGLGSDFLSGENVAPLDSGGISGAIAGASLLITDLSSVFADFYFQNKPVIFYRLDENDDKLTVSEKRDMAAAASQNHRVSNVFDNAEAVFDRLEHYIQNDFQMDAEERQKARAFFYEKENICGKVMEKICNNNRAE